MPITDEVAVKLVADIEELISGLKTAQAQTKESLDKIEESSTNVAEAFDNIKGKIMGGLEAAGVMLVYEAMERVKDAVDETASRFLELRSTAEAYQTTVPVLEGLHYALEEAGDSAYKADTAMRMLSRQMQAARDGSREAQESFAKVGISMDELRNPAFNGVQALVKLGQSTVDFSEKAKLLGRNAYELKDALQAASQGEEALAEKFKELGGVSGDQIAMLALYKKAVFDTETQWSNFKATMAISVAPVLINLNEALNDIFSTSDVGKLVMEGLVFTIKAAATAIIILSGGFNELVILVERFYDQLKEVVSGTLTLAAQLASSWNPKKILQNLEKEWHESGQRQAEIAQRATDQIKAIEKKGWLDIKMMWADLTEIKIADRKIDTGEKQRDVKPWQDPELEMLKFRMAMLKQGNLEDADERIRLAQQIAAREIETARGSVAQQLAGLAMIEQAVRANEALRRSIAKEDVATEAAEQMSKVEAERKLLDFRYSMQEISSGELLDGRKRLAERELEIETAKYKRLAELDKDNTAARKKDLDAIGAAVRANDAKIIAAQQDAAKQMKALWTQALHPIVDQFGQAFKSMLNATSSFKGAMQNLYMGLVNHFEDVAIQMAEKWIVTELLKTAATAEGAAARTAITEEEVLLSIAKKIWEGLKWIVVEAGKAFAGAFAAMVGIPYVGPAVAPAAAAGASAAVLGAASMITAEQGWLVPKDSPVNVHKDEMILPPDLSKGVQKMIKGGGAGQQPINVHIHAMDGMSVERVLRNNPDAVYRAVRGAVNRSNRGFVK